MHMFDKKWRQIPKKLKSGETVMVLQIKKWWMPTWHDCWYFYEHDNNKYWKLLITDLQYPPEIDNIFKDDLYYVMFGIHIKI